MVHGIHAGEETGDVGVCGVGGGGADGKYHTREGHAIGGEAAAHDACEMGAPPHKVVDGGGSDTAVGVRRGAVGSTPVVVVDHTDGEVRAMEAEATSSRPREDTTKR